MLGDIYDTGTPKYSSAIDIYDALQAMATGEEIGILAEMFGDVSWDGQDYYYVDNAAKLVERWEQTTNYGDKMWLMDVAAWQLSDEDANEWILQVLYNDDLAKRIGFRKVFVETVLAGVASEYKEVSEAFAEMLGDANRNDFHGNSCALADVMPSISAIVVRHRYSNLCSAVYNKLKGLRLETERQLIAESRAMLTGYDDFMFGLRANQALYEEQERMYQSKVALLQTQYEAARRQLLALALDQGVVLQLPDAPLMLNAREINNDGG